MNNDGPVIEYTTAEAITEGWAVTLDGSGNLIAADAITEVIIGIALNDAASGEACSVQLSGLHNGALVDGTAGGGISAGDFLSGGTVDGKMIVHNGAVGTAYAAKALEASAADNDKIRVLILGLWAE